MKLIFLVSVLAMITVACTSRDVGPYARTDAERQKEFQAAQNAECVFENQARCDHLIENRGLFGRFFAPETQGGMDENEKFRGRRITTNFVVEAVASIKQCNRVSAESVTIINGMEINGAKYLVRGTSPLAQQSSSCFITPQREGS